VAVATVAAMAAADLSVAD